MTPPKSSIVLDRELVQEKSLGPSGPRIRCPLCGWFAPQGRPLGLRLRPSLEHIRHEGSMPAVPPPLDFNPVPLVRSLVAAFPLVSELTGSTCGGIQCALDTKMYPPVDWAS